MGGDTSIDPVGVGTEVDVGGVSLFLGSFDPDLVSDETIGSSVVLAFFLDTSVSVAGDASGAGARAVVEALRL